MLLWLESLIRDTGQALRQMGRAPWLTSVLVCSLALGMGANTAVFSLVDAALLRPLPVHQPKLLRLITWTSQGWPDPICIGMARGTVSFWAKPLHGFAFAARTYRELADRQTGFAALIGFSDLEKAAVSIPRRPAEQSDLQYVSANFFQGLDALPTIGRPFSDADDRAGQMPAAIISNRFWRTRFNSASEVIGTVFWVNKVAVQVKGVAPPGFFGVKVGEWVDVYVPLSAQVALYPHPNTRAIGENDKVWWVRIMGRLKPSIEEAAAREELSTTFRHLAVPPGVHMRPENIPILATSPGERGFQPLGDDEVHALWVLLLLVGLVLLIVCANVAILLLSRSVARQREAAVSLALGAARGRLLRQYLVESLTLAAFSGGLGVFLGYSLAAALHRWIRSELKIGGFDVQIDWSVLLFTGGACVLAAILFGLAPAWQLTRTNLSEVLKARSRNFTAGRLNFPRTLVTTQFAVSLTLLFAAGLLTRSLSNLQSVNGGFDRRSLFYVTVNPWRASYSSAQVDQYVQRVREKLSAIPGVLRTASVLMPPLSGDTRSIIINVPGRPYSGSDRVLTNWVSDGFFETLGLALIAGRTFQPGDAASKPYPVVVDDLFVRTYYPDRNPLGQQFGYGPKPPEFYHIVGVVHSSLLKSVREAPEPVLYLPSRASSYAGGDVNFLIHALSDTKTLSSEVQKIARSLDPNVPVIAIESQQKLIDRTLLTERLLGMVSSAFGVLAVVLSAVGLLGLLGYSVARRRNEIGVRVALGATGTHIVGLVFRESMWIVALGFLLGLPGSITVGRVLRHSLFHARAADPATGFVAVGTLIIIATLASWLPARLAAGLDPMAAIREE